MDLFAFDDLYVRRLKEHDRETEAHFHQYFRALMFAKLRKRFAPEDIDDVVQDVFARVLPRLEDLRDSRKLGSFVLGFCNNILLERHRGASRTEPLTEEHERITDRSDAEAAFFTEEAAARIRLLLAELPERDADILRAIFLEDADRDEICRRFGITPDTLRVRLHRAKERFRALYGSRSKIFLLPPETLTLFLTLPM